MGAMDELMSRAVRALPGRNVAKAATAATAEPTADMASRLRDSLHLSSVKSLDEVDAGMPYNVADVPVTDPHSLEGKRIAIVAAHGFEEVEMTYPLDYLQKRGAQVDIISPDWIKDRVMAVQFLKPSSWIPVSENISKADINKYDGIIVPGGAWNPIIMRTDNQVLNFVQQAFQKGKMVASLCHGPQVLESAGILNGLDATGVGDIRQDLANAGAKVHNDDPLVVSKNVLTSRDPHDLAEFSQGIESYLTKQSIAATDKGK